MIAVIESVNRRVMLLAVLFIAVLVAAISVVYTKHLNRKYFVQLQQLDKHQDEMNVEWGQLQLEKSTFASSSEIEKSAREKLGMDQPKRKEIITSVP